MRIKKMNYPKTLRIPYFLRHHRPDIEEGIKKLNDYKILSKTKNIVENISEEYWKDVKVTFSSEQLSLIETLVAKNKLPLYKLTAFALYTAAQIVTNKTHSKKAFEYDEIKNELTILEDPPEASTKKTSPIAKSGEIKEKLIFSGLDLTDL